MALDYLRLDRYSETVFTSRGTSHKVFTCIMSSTPQRESPQFITKEVLSPSPNKEQPGISKTVFSHISSLHSFIRDWARMREKGSRHLDCISVLKLHECNDDYYPSQLKVLMANIVEILDSLMNIVEGVGILKTQMQALAKLQPSDDPVISTWPVTKISENVDSIYEQLQKEYRLKCVITENIAHCRDEKLIEVYLSSWELEPYISYDTNAYLFSEVGIT